jgi:anti-sigma-K factor RskA
MTPDHSHTDHERPDHERFADWDAAYVLGALSPAERREFETHLESCQRCRSAVAELTVLPGLLGRLDSARAVELLAVDDRADEGADAASDRPTPAPPAELVARIERRHRSRSRRIRALLAVAAAAVVASAIAIPLAITSTPHPTLTTSLSQVVASPLSAEVKLTTVGWGTKVEMNCHYGEAAARTPDDTRWDYALWVVSRDGASSELSSWSAKSDSTVTLAAGTSVAVDQIAAVQVRGDDGTLLLQSKLPG